MQENLNLQKSGSDTREHEYSLAVCIRYTTGEASIHQQHLRIDDEIGGQALEDLSDDRRVRFDPINFHVDVELCSAKQQMPVRTGAAKRDDWSLRTGVECQCCDGGVIVGHVTLKLKFEEACRRAIRESHDIFVQNSSTRIEIDADNHSDVRRIEMRIAGNNEHTITDLEALHPEASIFYYAYRSAPVCKNKIVLRRTLYALYAAESHRKSQALCRSCRH